ncbi:hypothetical protein NUW58_g8810 [Xylaria curta]|uniref:Uncharacterized protein n=1 Tax=Xylaria curta TaxID=42375 RepID=A0ACC1N3Z2_9PEZI|nr:hypothetical protein NUW58_g8810 [Xylaria curta]
MRNLCTLAVVVSYAPKARRDSNELVGRYHDGITAHATAVVAGSMYAPWPITTTANERRGAACPGWGWESRFETRDPDLGSHTVLRTAIHYTPAPTALTTLMSILPICQPRDRAPSPPVILVRRANHAAVIPPTRQTVGQTCAAKSDSWAIVYTSAHYDAKKGIAILEEEAFDAMASREPFPCPFSLGPAGRLPASHQAAVLGNERLAICLGLCRAGASRRDMVLRAPWATWDVK